MRTSTKKEYPLVTAVSALPSVAAQRPPDSPRSRTRRGSVDEVVQDEGRAWKSTGRRSKPGVGTTCGARTVTPVLGDEYPRTWAVGGGAARPEVVEQGSRRR